MYHNKPSLMLKTVAVQGMNNPNQYSIDGEWQENPSG